MSGVGELSPLCGDRVIVFGGGGRLDAGGVVKGMERIAWWMEEGVWTRQRRLHARDGLENGPGEYDARRELALAAKVYCSDAAVKAVMDAINAVGV